MLVKVTVRDVREITKIYDVDYDYEAIGKAQADYYNGRIITDETPSTIEIFLEENK